MNETGDKIDQHMPEVHHATYDAQDVTDDWTGLDTRSSCYFIGLLLTCTTTPMPYSSRADRTRQQPEREGSVPYRPHFGQTRLTDFQPFIG